MVDGIANVAAFDINASSQPITGVDLSGQVTFNVRSTGLWDTMPCGRIAKVFNLVACNLIIAARHYNDIDLTVIYEGRVIGSGKISSTDVATS